MDRRGELVCVVAEAHDTYGGRHACLRPGIEGHATVENDFSVSPFQVMTREYRMHVPEPEALLTVTVALRQGGETPLTATPRGVRRPARNRWLVRMLLVPQQISALIRNHGGALWFRNAPQAQRTPETAGGQLNG